MPRVASEGTTGIIDRNPGILGDTPVFMGTRVPVRILMEHLEAGDRLGEFLDDYPTVKREQTPGPVVIMIARRTRAGNCCHQHSDRP